MGKTAYWKQPLWLACYVSLWHKIHFGGNFTLSAQRGQDFATMKFNPWRQLFTTHRVWYEFNIFSKSDYKKRWADLYITPSTEYWNCKAGFWFLKLNVGCTTYMLCILVECWALNFQERVIMLNVESLNSIIKLECWNGKLKVGCYNLILILIS